MIGAEKPVHYNRVFTITESTINGIDCNKELERAAILRNIDSYQFKPSLLLDVKHKFRKTTNKIITIPSNEFFVTHFQKKKRKLK